MLIKLAKRLSVVEPSMTLKVTAKAAELRAQGVDVVSFGAGEPDFDTPAHIKEAAKKALDAGATKYTAVEGTPQLRKAAATWLGKAHGFEVNPKEVARAITPRTRIILIVSPSNPTGAVYDEKTLRALADLAVRHDIWLLTDDIYRSLCYGDARFVQPATFSPEVRRHAIIVDGVSKSFAMTGWRIGFCVAPLPVIEGMSTLQSQSTTNAAAVSQAAAVAALEGPTDELER